MSVAKVETCDVCHREVPLRGVKGQNIYRGRFRKSWYWWGRGEEMRHEITFCEDCWDGMRAEMLEARERAGGDTSDG